MKLTRIAMMLLAGLAVSSPAEASFLWDNVSVNYEWPNLGTVLFSGGTAAVTASGTIFDLSSGGIAVNVTQRTSTSHLPPAGILLGRLKRSMDWS